MAELGAYLKSINTSKENIMRDSEDPKAVSGYLSWIVRKLLSSHEDAVLAANMVNMFQMEPQLQYEFLLHILPKRYRYSQTIKPIIPQNLELIKKFYNYSDVRALEVLDLHSESDFVKMRKQLKIGGIESDETS